MRILRNLFLAAVMSTAVAAWADDTTNKPAANAKEVAVMDTTDGQMVIEF